MAALRLILVAAALGVGGAAFATKLDRWQTYIDEASARCGVPALWIERVMQAESKGQTMYLGRPIRSRAGAMGLMQLMPATWEEMRRAYGLGADPDDPRANIIAGACYLRHMYDRFGYPGLFAGYNAGPGRYARHLATGAPLPGETIAYLAAVTGKGAERPPAATPSAQSDLFSIRAVPQFADQDGSNAEPDHSLFVVRRNVP